ncbi:MAG: hypothetical protein ACFFCS_03800 [Candidatus Hodarchaeota archaeon]
MVSIVYSTKNRLRKVARYVSGIVFGLMLVIGLEYLLNYFFGVVFDVSQEILFFALISFFSLVLAVLSLNVDLTQNSKWRLLLSFIFWSVISFMSGFYASVSAVQVIDESLFPIVSFLAQVWKSYILLFFTCVNFISASFLFHKIANAIQVDTIEWFKRGYGTDGDPPKVSLSPVAKKILFGLIAQLTVNVLIYAYGSPEAFFNQMSIYLQDLVNFISGAVK